MTEDPAILRAIAGRVFEGGCCGRRSKVTKKDLIDLGLWPAPPTFDSSLGRIVPMSGWKSMVVWMLEALSGQPYPRQKSEPGMEPPDPGLPLAEYLEHMSDEKLVK